jgi:hypothetical protein
VLCACGAQEWNVLSTLAAPSGGRSPIAASHTGGRLQPDARHGLVIGAATSASKIPKYSERLEDPDFYAFPIL